MVASESPLPGQAGEQSCASPHTLARKHPHTPTWARGTPSEETHKLARCREHAAHTSAHARAHVHAYTCTHARTHAAHTCANERTSAEQSTKMRTTTTTCRRVERETVLVLLTSGTYLYYPSCKSDAERKNVDSATLPLSSMSSISIGANLCCFSTRGCPTCGPPAAAGAAA